MDIIPREILLDAIENPNPNPEALLEWFSGQRQKQMPSVTIMVRQRGTII